MTPPIDLFSAVAALEDKRALAVAADTVLSTISARDLINEQPEEPDWLVPGLLAKGWAMIVSAREKTGKGTLIAHIIGCLESQRPTVFGPPCLDTHSALIFTEEPRDSTAEKARYSALQRSSYVFSWDLPLDIRTLPVKDGAQWAAVVRVLVNTAVAGGHSLLFIDNISRASRVEDESGVEMSRRVEVAAEACKAAGLTLIVDHHHRKAAGDMRDRSRGGTGSAGAVDVALSMDRGKDSADRKRALMCVGRRMATNWSSTIELDEDGCGYRMLSEEQLSEDKPRTASLEQRRVDMLLELNQERAEEGAPPGVTMKELSALWSTAVGTARRYVADRIPSGTIIEGESRSGSRTYLAPGFKTPDLALGPKVKRTKPGF